MEFINLASSIGVIGGADGPTAVLVAGLPLPAITVSLFAILFVLYVYIAKAIASKKAPAQEPAQESAQAPAPVAAPVAPKAQNVYTGPELVGVEEKEAAVIMAIVSDKTGIPLSRLRFESIKLMEDK